jgi:hypothetical protein
MAKISADKIVWDVADWADGLNEQYGVENTNKNIGRSLNYVQAFDPYRIIGYATPGYLPTTLGNSSVVDAVILKSVSYGTSKREYGITSTKKIVEYASSKIENGTGYPHTVNDGTGDATALWDIVTYTSKATVGGGADPANTRIFYSWARSGGSTWGVGLCYPPTATAGFFVDNFMKTAPATPLTPAAGSYAYPHPMIVGDDDLLYIGDGPRLHAFDGQYASDDDGKFYDSVLTLPSTFRIKSFEKYNGFLLIFADENESGTAYTSRAKVFFWDYLSLDPTYIKDLNDNLVTEAFIFQGKVGCFTSGRRYDTGISNTGKIQFLEGNEFYPKIFFNDSLPVRGGVNVASNQLRWNSAGKLYAYGNNMGLPERLNILAKGGGTTSGMLSDGSGVLIMSSGTTTSGGLQSFSNTIGSTTFTGSGLDDGVATGRYTGTGSATFEVEITGTGTPDVFKWKKDSGSYTTGVNATSIGTPITLSDGVYFNFRASTGHTAGDKWTFTVTADPNYESSAYLQTTSAQPNFGLRKKGRVKRVKLIFGDTNPATADTLTVKLYYDRGGSYSTIASAISEITTSTLIMEYEHDTSGNPLPDFEALSLKLEWGSGSVHTSSPWLQSAEIEYETINI